MACCCSDDDGVFVHHRPVGRLRVDNTPACPRFGRLEVSVIAPSGGYMVLRCGITMHREKDCILGLHSLI
jgi:hypothetical protein